MPGAAGRGDPVSMDATAHTRLGVADLGGLIMWGTGLGLLLVGVAADSSGDAVAGGARHRLWR
jgi:hypothetical protein